MKLRLTQGGFEGYTGQMGVVVFENGLSVGDVLPIDAIRLAGVMGAEWEDGTAANVGQMYLNNLDTPAPMFEPGAQAGDPVIAATPVVDAGVAYTADQLADIADKDGISGLRAIADPLNVKGNSIRGLIDGILKAAGAQKVE
jgi:hypothetical protein